MGGTGEKAERFVADECERIGRLCWSQGNPQLILLRAHLLIEHYMERLLGLYLRRGDRVVNGRFTFTQKLVLIEGLDAISDVACQAIRKLNSVRNGMVHKMDYKIASSDIDKIGGPFGKDFTEVRTRCADSPHDFLCATLNLIFREICCAVFASEATGQPRPAGE